MTQNLLRKPGRLEVVDALRGFALLAIVLLHNLEHYNIYTIPQWEPQWLLTLDKWVWDFQFVGLAGKAYATFSLMFGLSFYIQLRNARARGTDFRARFAWRMLLLFLFAQFHALFYNGDILVLYSIVGLVLIAVCQLSDKTVFWIAVVCLLQPFEWGRALWSVIDPSYVPVGNLYQTYANLNVPVTMNGSMWEVMQSNIWHGQLFSNLWQLEAGRVFLTAALFMFGMLLGRRDYFVRSERSVKFWKMVVKWAAIAFVPLWLLKAYVPDMITSDAVRVPINVVLPSLWNFSFMILLVGGFTLCWFLGRSGNGYKFQRFIMPYGSMTLTNYISQSIVGVCIYYGFGLGLYPYTGATLSTLIALSIFAAQWFFSRWWLSKFSNGPLEYIWRRGTWIGAKR